MGRRAEGLQGRLPFTLPFLLLGIWLIRLPRLLREHDRRMWYVLTDQRAIVWRPSLFGCTTKRASYTPEDLRRMECDPCGEEFGSLVFHTVSAYSEDSSGYGFLNIRDPRRVEALIRKTLLSGGLSQGG